MYNQDEVRTQAVNDGYEVPHWPRICQDCNSMTVVALLVVEENGVKKRGAFSEFGYVNKMNKWILPTRYVFKGWETYCNFHNQVE